MLLPNCHEAYAAVCCFREQPPLLLFLFCLVIALIMIDLPI